MNITGSYYERRQNNANLTTNWSGAFTKSQSGELAEAWTLANNSKEWNIISFNASRSWTGDIYPSFS